MRFSRWLFLVAALVGAVVSQGNALALSVGVNFNRNADEVFAATTSAGAVPQMNWNQTPTAGTGVDDVLFDLTDSNGATVTGMNVFYTAANTWASGAANTADGNISLLKGYLDDGGAGSQVDVEGIPYAEYDLYIYAAGDQGQGPPLADYTVTHGVDTFNPVWAQAASLAPGGVLIDGSGGGEGHYYVIQGLTETNLSIAGLNNAGAGRAPLSGFQIVDANTIVFDGALRASIDRDSGEITLSNNTGAAVDIAGMSLLSDRGALVPGSWTSIAGNHDNGGSVSADEWFVVSSDASDLSEVTLGTGTLTQTQSVSLGTGAWSALPFEDVTFEYLDAATGETKIGLVSYTGNGGDSLLVGDFDNSGAVDALDWPTIRDGFNSDLAGVTGADAYAVGDIDGDLDVDLADLLAFEAIYDAANGAGSFASLSASVPEPSTCILLLMGVALMFSKRLARKVRLVPMLGAVALTCLLASSSYAVSIGVNFTESNDGGATPRPEQTLAPATTAGLFGAVQPNWNSYSELMGEGGASETPVDSTGAVTAASVTWETSNSWGNGIANPIPDNGDDALARSYFDDGVTMPAGTGVTIDMANVPYANYSVVLYLSSDQGDGGTYGTYTVNGNAQTNGNATSRFNVGATSYGGWVPNANAMIFTGLTASALDIDIQERAGTTRASIAGFQVIEGDLDYQLTLEVNTDTGNVSIRNDGVSGTFDINYFEINSASGALDEAGWTPLGTGTTDGSDWEALGNLDDNLLAQFHLQGTGSYSDGTTTPLGHAYSGGAQDLTFNYHVGGLNATLEGKVVYVTGGGQDGDFDGDGDVDGADFLTWQVGFPTAPHDAAGYALWESNYGFGSGPGNGSLSGSAVPEPSTLVLFGIVFVGVALSFFRHKGVRSMKLIKVTAMSAFTALFMAQAAFAVVHLDRHYQFGDAAGESPSAGSDIFTTVDSEVTSAPDDQQDLNTNISGVNPTYVNLSTVGSGRTGWGASFSGTSEIRGDRLNRPDETVGNGVDLVGDGPVLSNYPFNYAGIGSRGLQMWVYPNASALGTPATPTTRQSIVFDTFSSGGPAISATGMWGQSNAAHIDDAQIAVSVPVVGDTWHHVMQHAFPDGEAGSPSVVPGTGGARSLSTVVFVDGIAVSANNDNWFLNGSISGDRNGELVIGSEDLPDFAIANHFDGVIDDLQMYVYGDNTAQGGQDYGTFDLFADNAWIADAITALPNGVLLDGDINRDGAVNGDGTGDANVDDVSAFIAGWTSTPKIFQGAHNQIAVGDWETWGNGDLDHDGDTDFSDWFILRANHPSPGSLNLGSLLGGSVPEPSSIALLLLGVLSFLGMRYKC